MIKDSGTISIQKTQKFVESMLLREFHVESGHTQASSFIPMKLLEDVAKLEDQDFPYILSLQLQNDYADDPNKTIEKIISDLEAWARLLRSDLKGQC